VRAIIVASQAACSQSGRSTGGVEGGGASAAAKRYPRRGMVEGSVRQAGDRLRIAARLVDVHTGKVIWSETYDRSAVDPGEVESQVAAEVTAQVGAHLSIHGEFPLTRPSPRAVGKPSERIP
jgi:TolB-like protein